MEKKESKERKREKTGGAVEPLSPFFHAPCRASSLLIWRFRRSTCASLRLASRLLEISRAHTHFAGISKIREYSQSTPLARAFLFLRVLALSFSHSQYLRLEEASWSIVIVLVLFLPFLVQILHQCQKIISSSTHGPHPEIGHGTAITRVT